MTQPDLLSWQPPEPKGQTYVPERDGARLNAQCRDVYAAFLTGRKFTLRELEDMTGHPQASISARFRDLKRAGYPMEKEYAERGKYLYWMRIERAA